MKKIKDDEDLRAIARERADIKRRLYERYFNLFASSWEWEGFVREEREAIIRSLWTRGTIGALRISDELLAYVPYAPQDFNLYGTPVTAVPVPSRTAPYIPTRALSTSALRINVARGVEEPEIVLGWAQHTLRPIRDSLADWVDDLVELEMAIRMNIDLQKIPFVFKCTNQNEAKLRNLIQRVTFGSSMVAIGVDEVGSVDAMTTGAPYLLDKLEEQKERIEKEVLTFLGIDNLKEKLRTNHIFRLQQEQCSIEVGFVWSDLLTNLERTSDHCSNIAGCIIDTAQHNLNLHETLRAASMQDERFKSRFDMYAERYRLPASPREDSAE